MMAGRQGDIVLVDFPFTSTHGSKLRPALIISNDAYNRRRPDRLMVPLTTRSEPAELLLPLNDSDFAAGALVRPSAVRYDRVTSLAATAVRRTVARLAPQAMARVRECIGGLLA